ncbi:MAG: hypothetical protein XU10_C0006G0093 [Chloroflexi bacterium CSP1-4]|jgi:hypothetical protein|nr:MAG: hypothetical protein XU10_C0006G0093 [Chloroflexi bacterium CSP1-4]
MAPTVEFVNNESPYAVDETITISCAAADNVGIDRERTDCPSITGPAQILVDLSYGL